MCQEPHTVIPSSPIIIPIQTMHSIQFLTIILISLHTATCTFRHQATKWIVMIHLLHFTSSLINSYPITTKMVFQIIMIHGLSINKRDVTSIYQYLRQLTILINHVITIVQSHTWVWYSRYIGCLQLLALCIIDITDALATFHL